MWNGNPSIYESYGVKFGDATLERATQESFKSTFSVDKIEGFEF